MTCPLTWLRKPRATYPPNLPKSLRALGAHLCQFDLISNTCSSIHLPSHHFPLHLHPRPRSSPLPQTCSTFNAPTSSLKSPPGYTFFLYSDYRDLKEISLLVQLTCAMSLLDQLWDDTLAGPRPENGLGKLRKHSTFSFRSNSAKGTQRFAILSREGTLEEGSY